MFGFDFRVEYRPGRLNTVADALSRRDSEELAMHAISTPTFNFYDALRREIETTLELARCARRSSTATTMTHGASKMD